MRQITRHKSKSMTILFLTGLLVMHSAVMSLTVEGVNFPATVEMAGKELKLLGAGVREKWFIDIYTMGAYSESGSCDTSIQLKNNEMRYMHIKMLRTVSAKQIAEAFKDAFGNNTPENASKKLKDTINKAVSYFKQEATKGSTFEFTYIPGEGLVIKQNEKKLGETWKGKDFADVVWNCYFSNRTCCKNLKKGILKTCKAK